MVPAEGELLLINEAVSVLIEHLEDVARPLLGQRVDVALVVAEQSLADHTELVQA